MVSRGPYTMSYVPVTPMLTVVHQDLKDGLMQKIATYSPQFAKLITKAQMEGIFNSPKSKLTVFAPCNLYPLTDELIEMMSISQCIDIVQSSVLDCIAKTENLSTSSYWKVPTRKKFTDVVIRLTRNRRILINNSEIVEGDICAVNGIIHLMNGLITEKYIQ